MLKDEPNMRTGPYGFHDKVFANEMNKLMNATDSKYNAMLFREVLREGFFGMIDARDKYRELTANEQGMHATLIRQFIEWQAIGENLETSDWLSQLSSQSKAYKIQISSSIYRIACHR